MAAPPSRHAPTHPAADGAERRAFPRRTVDQASTVRGDDDLPVEAVLRDVSATGFSIRSDAPLAVGTRVRVGLPGVGQVKAKVRWATDSAYGCEFARLLLPTQLSAAFASDTVVDGRFPTILLPAHEFAEPQIEKWPAAIRFGMMIGVSCALWAGIWLAFRAVL